MTHMTETQGVPSEFSAHEAARTLERLETYEDTMNTRAGALSWMFFGMGAAGIFVTYEAASRTLIELGLPWLLLLLWVPWILGASILTNHLWKMLAVTTKTEYDARRGWLASLGGTLGFFAIAGVLWFGSQAAGLELTLRGPIPWVLVVGIFTTSLALYQGHRFGAPVLRNAFITAGAALFLGGILMAVSPPAEGTAGLIGAGLTLFSYFAAALYVYHRG